jgi:hypothetical protein
MVELSTPCPTTEVQDTFPLWVPARGGLQRRTLRCDSERAAKKLPAWQQLIDAGTPGRRDAERFISEGLAERAVGG